MNALPPAGWYQDPKQAGRLRYWDGSHWTEHEAPGQSGPQVPPSGGPGHHAGTPPQALRNKNWLMRHKVLTAVGAVLAVFLFLAILGALLPTPPETTAQPDPAAASDSAKAEPSDSPSESEKAEPSPEPSDEPSESEKPSPPPSPEDKVREALGNSVSSDFAVGDAEVRSVNRSGSLMYIVLGTPEGGFDGPSTDDADALASAAFAKTYLADWKGPTTAQFRGGLQSSATGKALPNAVAFTYRIEPAFAKQIDWSDEDTLFAIDWGFYRTFCHPAFKGC